MYKVLKMSILCGLLVFGVACGETADPPDENNSENNVDKCTPTVDYYKTNIAPILSSKCTTCHGDGGIGFTGSPFKLTKADLSDETSRASIKLVIGKKEGNTALLLLKASGQTGHTGGGPVMAGSDEYKKLEELVSRVNTPKTCDTDSPF